MHSANLALWIAGLSLQSLLVFMLFWRRLVRSFPVFTCLIAFYVLRSALFYVLSQQHAPHKDLSTSLSIIDLCLQVLLVIEISLRSLAAAREKPSHWSSTLLQLSIEGVIAAAVAMLVPETQRVRLDRAIVFVMILMILRLIWMWRHQVCGIPRSIAVGFALYGIAVTATTLTQNFAAESRNSVEFTAAAYANAAVYLGIVVYWIVAVYFQAPNAALQPNSRQGNPNRASR